MLPLLLSEQKFTVKHFKWYHILSLIRAFKIFQVYQVLHYLQAVLFIKIWTIFMNIQHSLKSGGTKDHFRRVKAGADPGFQVRGGAHLNFLGYFVWKNHDFMPKNHIFSNFRGERSGCASWIHPWKVPGTVPYWKPVDTSISIFIHVQENKQNKTQVVLYH